MFQLIIICWTNRTLAVLFIILVLDSLVTLVNKTSKIYQYKEYLTNLIITITSLSDYLTINGFKFCLKGQDLNHVVFYVLNYQIASRTALHSLVRNKEMIRRAGGQTSNQVKAVYLTRGTGVNKSTSPVFSIVFDMSKRFRFVLILNVYV